MARATRCTRPRSSSSCCRMRSSPSRSSRPCCRRCPSVGAIATPTGSATSSRAGLRDTVVVIVPAAFGFLVLAGPIVALLLEYGAATRPTPGSSRARCRRFAIGLPFFSAFQLLTRTFYATQDSRTPALVNVGGGVVNVAVDVVLVRRDRMGRAGARARPCGVATCSPPSSGSCCFAAKLGSLDGRRVGRTIGRAVPAAARQRAAAGSWPRASPRSATPTVLWRLVQVGSAVAAGVLVFVAAALMSGSRRPMR